MLRKKEEKKDKFDLEIEIENAIKITEFKPLELRHNEDKKIIEILNKNIIKYMKRKLKPKNNMKKNTLLLLCPELEIRNNVYFFKKIKSKKLFVIPVIFRKFLNSNIISVKIMVKELKPLNINLGDTINISIECCRIIDFILLYLYDILY